jgi:hypothetical protein
LKKRREEEGGGRREEKGGRREEGGGRRRMEEEGGDRQAECEARWAVWQDAHPRVLLGLGSGAPVAPATPAALPLAAAPVCEGAP